jgi:hypothetical protein
MAGLPVTALTFAGSLLVILGLFAAGNMVVVGTGLVALVAAAILGILIDRQRSA